MLIEASGAVALLDQDAQSKILFMSQQITLPRKIYAKATHCVSHQLQLARWHIFDDTASKADREAHARPYYINAQPCINKADW